jgi:hypothetical protein
MQTLCIQGMSNRYQQGIIHKKMNQKTMSNYQQDMIHKKMNQKTMSNYQQDTVSIQRH